MILDLQVICIYISISILNPQSKKHLWNCAKYEGIMPALVCFVFLIFTSDQIPVFTRLFLDFILLHKGEN